ncbi:hypothetical protein BH20CHL6_BH20CHL6_09440 [soil metagenome]
MTRMRRWYVWLPISLLLLGLVVWRTRPWEVTALWERLDPLPLMAALLINVPIVALWAIRSRSLMAAVGHPLPLRELVPIVSFANTINNITPASSGEVLRALVLKRRHGVPFTRSGAVILIERFWAIGIMGLSAGAAAVGTLAGAPASLSALAWSAAVAGAFAPSIAYRLGLRPGRLLRRWGDPGAAAADDAAVVPGSVAGAAAAGAAAPPGRVRRLAAGLAELDDVLGEVVTDPRQAVSFVGTTALIFLGFALQLWLVLLALRVSLPIEAAWAALGLATIAGVASALPFGLGATDVVLVVLLTSMGVATAPAGAAVLLLRATATLPLGIAGAASWGVLSRGGQSLDVAAPSGEAQIAPATATDPRPDALGPAGARR